MPTPTPVSTDKVADEISASLEALVGSTMPASDDSSVNMFANLQFGRNYTPGNR